MITRRLQISLMLYLIIVGAIVFLNPSFLYDKQGKVKILVWEIIKHFFHYG